MVVRTRGTMTHIQAFEKTENGITIRTWMISYRLWAWLAVKGNLHPHGNVTADNRLEAWDKAFAVAEPEIFAAERAELFGV